jgi:hypothetical protein
MPRGRHVPGGDRRVVRSRVCARGLAGSVTGGPRAGRFVPWVVGRFPVWLLHGQMELADPWAFRGLYPRWAGSSFQNEDLGGVWALTSTERAFFVQLTWTGLTRTSPLGPAEVERRIDPGVPCFDYLLASASTPVSISRRSLRSTSCVERPSKMRYSTATMTGRVSAVRHP